jgi:GTP-binding protein
MMIIHSAEFVVSNSDPLACPRPDKPEFAFIGRSNVGKSSLINSLAGKKGLAMTSSTPGKTQLINHFLINQSWYLVDLPGYGFAQMAKSKHQTLAPMIESYLKTRKNLVTTFVLVDPRHRPQGIDQDFIQWIGVKGIPFSLVFTKSDKLKRQELKSSMQEWEETLSATWAEIPPVFITSAEKNLGRKELLGYIQTLLKPD